MKASFGANISGLRKPSTIWMDDATYKDTSGRSTMTASETDKVTSALSATGSTFKKINPVMLKKFLNLQESMTGALAGASLKTYNNSKVRTGETIKNPKQHAQGYVKWIEMSIQKQIDKAKSDKGKDKYAKDDYHKQNNGYDQIMSVSDTGGEDQIMNVNGKRMEGQDQINSDENHDNTDLCTYDWTPTYKGSASTVYYYVNSGWGEVPPLMIIV